MSSSPRDRDPVVDLVRAAALVRVIAFHASGNLVLLTAVPAIPVMFFIGGTFAARSLRGRPATEVVTARARGIGVPALVHVVVVVAALIAVGHAGSDVAQSLTHALLPNRSGSGTLDSTADWLFSTLWYLRDYLVLIAVSPLLDLALRRHRGLTLAAVGVFAAGCLATHVADSTAVYLCCWTAGMTGLVPGLVAAHRARVGVGAVVAAVLGAVLVVGPWSATNETGVLVAGAGWIAGIEVWRASLRPLALRPLVARASAWMVERAVSVYLWQMVVIVAAFEAAGIEDRSLAGHLTAALWIVPVSFAGTLALAAVVAPIERWARARPAATLHPLAGQRA